jgi:hypothetical protein
MNTKTLLVHIGTHKTGTTSLQIFLEQNRKMIEKAGLTLPRAGRPVQFGTGNHVIGWNLLVHERSEELQQLAAELAASPNASALITSEDLCLVYARPKALGLLKEAVEAGGHTAKVIVYFRPQAGYAESIYVERIKHDYVRTMASFIERSLDEGMYVPDGSPIQIEFQYSRLLGPWMEAFGRENMIVRAYQPGQPNDVIFREFLGIVAQETPQFAKAEMQLAVLQPRANDSLTFGALLQTAFQKLLPGRPPEFEPAALIRAGISEFPEPLLTQRYALMSREETLAFLHRFGPDNARIERDFGIHIPFQDESDVLPPEHPLWERARVERAIFDRLLDIWMAKR